MGTAMLTRSTVPMVTLQHPYLRLSEDARPGRTFGTLWERFAAKVGVSDDGCWRWLAGRNHDYGQLYHAGRPQKAHRMAWLMFRGDIPDGLNVLHHCDNPGCVNPEHLFLGTQNDNFRDMVAKGRGRVMPAGSAHPRAKLSPARRDAVRLLLSDGVRPTAIARCLGVSIQTICRVRDGLSYVEGSAA
jgi:hypothetical protein